VIDPNAAINAIMAKAKELTTVDVFEAGVPDNFTPTMIPGTNQIKPYVILDFAGLTEAPGGYNGITGAADDTFMENFSTHSVASTPGTARQVNGLLLRKFLGFTPPNCGEIRPAFFGGIGESSTLSDPARYSAAQAYRLPINP
jgi:hypothetical protein